MKLKQIFVLVVWLNCWQVSQANAAAVNDSGSGLPFRLASFTAQLLQNNKVNINFVNAETFTNVTHFEILRSYNNIDYTVVGTVAQTSNAPTSHSYSYEDLLPNNNIPKNVYYKLKQITNQRTNSESHIVILKIKTKETNEVDIWPNPVINTMQIHCKTATTGTIEIIIYNNTGNIVQQGSASFYNGNDTIKWPKASELKNGTYAIVLQQNKKIISQTIFIKM